MASTESTNDTTPAVNNSNNNNNNNNNCEAINNGSKKVEMSAVIGIINLILWIFTFVLLLIAMIVLATNNKSLSSLDYDSPDDVLHFQDFYAYRYMLSAIVIGIVYTLSQLGFSIYRIITKAKGILLLDFYGDKIISYLLATGAAAGFGLTKDLNANSDKSGGSEAIDEFCSKGYASASLVLIAFLCTAVLSVMSSYALAKRV